MVFGRIPKKSYRKRKAAKKAKRKGRGGFSNKVYTVTFKPASQVLHCSTDALPGSPPLYLTSGSGNQNACLLPLFPTPVIPEYSQNIALNSSTTSLPNCQDIGMALTFNALNVENIASYLNLFDQYRINWVKVDIENLYPSGSIGYSATGTATVARPYSDLYIAKDFDSAAVPTTMQQVTGISGVQMKSFTDGRSRFSTVVVPRAAEALETFDPVTHVETQTTVKVGKPRQWINSTGPNVTHYGLKMWYTNWVNTFSSQQITALRFTFTFNMSFKQPLKAC